MAKLPFGSPTVTPSAASRATPIASSIRPRGASMRVGALQVWPELPITAPTPAATFFAKSASSRTMPGDLPPSS
jgi:hypothetical protein